jgi:hypothetical protein
LDAYVLGAPNGSSVKVCPHPNHQTLSLPVDLPNLMSADSLFKIFEGKSVVCCGSSFVPEKHDWKEKVLLPCLSIIFLIISPFQIIRSLQQRTWVIIGMGAHQVVAMAKMPTLAAINKFDYVVCHDKDLCTSVPKAAKKIVTWEWVKDCLLAGRLLPY